MLSQNNKRNERTIMRELSGKQRIEIADILCRHYARGSKSIQPLPAIVRKVFGEERLTQYPMFPQKKIRDFVDNLEEEDILNLLMKLSDNDEIGETEKIVDQLNEVLAQVGLKLESGKLLTLAEEEIKLIDDEITFLSILDSLGFSDIRSTLEKGFKGLREKDPNAASSYCSLAFDSLLKKAIATKGGNEDQTLGKLVEEALEHGIIEKDVVPVFQAFISLRNKVPQHSGRGGSVTSLSQKTALLMAHMARVLMTYLIS